MHNILAIDPGTNCGYCVGADDRSMTVSGVWNLKQDRFAGGGMRYLRFKQRLDEIHAAHPINQVAFEEVRNHKGVDAAHVYGGILAVLTSWCEQRGIPYQGIPVGTIKRYMTGKGNAGKPEVQAAVQARGFEPQDDNEADAIAIFLLVTEPAVQSGVATAVKAAAQ